MTVFRFHRPAMLTNVPRAVRPAFAPVTPSTSTLPAADQALFDAIARHDPEALRAALTRGANVHAIRHEEVEADHDSWVEEHTPLTDALRVPGPVALTLVSTLLDAGASIEHPSFFGRNALSMVARMGRWDLVNRLLDHTATPPEEDIEHHRSVHRHVLGAALSAAETTTLKRLVEQGWRWNHDPSQDGWLHAFLDRMQRREALPAGWLATLDLCMAIDPGAINVHRRQHPSNTALTMAVASGHPELVQAVLDHGADANQPIHEDVWADDEAVPRLIWEDHGVTPLHVAARNDRTEICEILIRYGADVHRRADTAWTVKEAAGAWHFNQPLPASSSPPLTALDAARRHEAHAAAALLEREMLRLPEWGASSSSHRARSRL